MHSTIGESHVDSRCAHHARDDDDDDTTWTRSTFEYDDDDDDDDDGCDAWIGRDRRVSHSRD